MNKTDLSKVQTKRREKGLRSSRCLFSNVFYFIFGERSEKFALAAKKNALGEKKISLALSRDQLRLVSAAVLSCHNGNFKMIGTPEEKKELKRNITYLMIQSTK